VTRRTITRLTVRYLARLSNRLGRPPRLERRVVRAYEHLIDMETSRDG
jgi:hypothetical protein